MSSTNIARMRLRLSLPPLSIVSFYSLFFNSPPLAAFHISLSYIRYVRPSTIVRNRFKTPSLWLTHQRHDHAILLGFSRPVGNRRLHRAHLSQHSGKHESQENLILFARSISVFIKYFRRSHIALIENDLNDKNQDIKCILGILVSVSDQLSKEIFDLYPYSASLK